MTELPLAQTDFRKRIALLQLFRIDLGSNMFISVASERTSTSEDGQLHLSIARSRSHLEQAFKLVHHSYVQAGLQKPNPLGMRLLRQHFLRETDVVVATMSDVVVSTASMIADSDLGLPAETMYRKEIDEVRNRGLRLAEIGCLADRRDAKLRFIEVFRFLSCLIAQAAVSRAYDGLIVATHPRHARFYMRQLGFRRIGEIRECPYVQGSPAVPLLFDFEERRGSAVHDFLFQQPYSPEELAPYVWDEETRAHFYAALTQLGEGGEKKLESSGVGPVFSLPVQSSTVQHYS